MPPEFQPRPLLQTLARHEVDFVLVGGLAGVARGSSYPTYDVDIAYARDPEPISSASPRRSTSSKRRSAARPPMSRSLLDAETLRQGAHFTFDTTFGSLDVLDRPDGAPPYAELVELAGAPLLVAGVPVRVASLDHLIAMKEASRRPKDLLMATEYRQLSDELRAP